MKNNLIKFIAAAVMAVAVAMPMTTAMAAETDNDTDALRVGDFNGDGFATREDYNLLDAYLKDNNAGLPCRDIMHADITENNEINVYDLLTLDKFMGSNLKGDVNDDGEVTQADFTMYKNYKDGNIKTMPNMDNADPIADHYDSNAAKPTLRVGDFNGDGSATKEDYDLLDAYLKDNSVGLPCTDIMHADITGNNEINVYDLLTLDKFYGSNLKGDVNADGEITQADYTMLKNYVNKNITTMPNMDNADVNTDGTVDFFDIAALKALV